MGALILVTGGARSGKSAHAVALARGTGGPVLFHATAEALDAGMAERIRRHRASRPAAWTTLEEPIRIVRGIEEARRMGAPTVLLDCVTLWTSNRLLRGDATEAILDSAEGFVRDAASFPGLVVAVTGETGLGVVPANDLARRHVDLLGEVNQRLAAAAAQVVLLVAGVPVRIK